MGVFFSLINMVLMSAKSSGVTCIWQEISPLIPCVFWITPILIKSFIFYFILNKKGNTFAFPLFELQKTIRLKRFLRVLLMHSLQLFLPLELQLLEAYFS